MRAAARNGANTKVFVEEKMEAICMTPNEIYSKYGKGSLLHWYLCADMSFTEKNAFVRRLLELGADANYVVKTKDIVGNQTLNRLGYCEGDSVLHHCIDVEFCEVLIHAGADIHKRNRVGQTPLHLTVDSACTKLLIESGAQVNALDNEGRTPLHLAYDCKCAELLIRAGANLNIKDNRGRTGLQYHIEKMYSGITEERTIANYLQGIPQNPTRSIESVYSDYSDSGLSSVIRELSPSVQIEYGTLMHRPKASVPATRQAPRQENSAGNKIFEKGKHEPIKQAASSAEKEVSQESPNEFKYSKDLAYRFDLDYE